LVAAVKDDRRAAPLSRFDSAPSLAVSVRSSAASASIVRHNASSS